MTSQKRNSVETPQKRKAGRPLLHGSFTSVTFSQQSLQIVEKLGGQPYGKQHSPNRREVIDWAFRLVDATLQGAPPLPPEEIALLLEIFPNPVTLTAENLLLLPHLVEINPNFTPLATAANVDPHEFLDRLKKMSRLERLALGTRLMTAAAAASS